MKNPHVRTLLLWLGGILLRAALVHLTAAGFTSLHALLKDF